MNIRLFPPLPLNEDETAASYVSRLSFLHTGLPANRLLADLGVDVRDFSRGLPQALGRVAEAAGVAVSQLARGMISRSERCRKFRGETWSSDFVIPEGRRVCPACLQEDAPTGEPWLMRGRILWRLRPVTTCPIHECALVERPFPNSGDELARDFPRFDQLVELPSRAGGQKLTSVESMIVARLNDVPTNADAWLDGQTLEQASRACEMIGLVKAFGKKFVMKDLSRDDWRHAAELGFASAQRGEEGIRAAFDEMLAITPSAAGQAGPRNGYGRLFEWLADTTPIVDFGPIRPLLRDHVLDHYSVKPGEMLLGEKVYRRRMHSVHSLAVNTRIHRKRLRKALVQLGYIGDDTWDAAAHHLMVPAVIAEQISKDLKESVALQLLPELLLCSRTQAESIYREGVLDPLLDKDPVTGIGRIAFAQRTIDAFLKLLEDLPVVEAVAPPSYVDLTTAAKKTSLTTGVIIREVFEGGIGCVRLPGAIGLLRIRLFADDLRGLIEDSRPAPRSPS